MAAGRMHFRCLSCDRVRPGMSGPATDGFLNATGVGGTLNDSRMFSVGNEARLDSCCEAMKR